MKNVDIRSLALVFTLRFFYLASGFLIASATTKLLDVAGFGIFSVSQAIVLLVYSFSIAGVSTLIVRETANDSSVDGVVTSTSLIGSLFRWVFCTAILTFVLALVVLLIVGSDGTVLITTAVGLPAILLLGSSVVMNSVLRGKNRVFESQISDLFLRPAVYLLTVVVLRVTLSKHASPVAVMLAFDLATFVAVAFSYSRFKRLNFENELQQHETEQGKSTGQLIKQLASIDLIHAISLYSPTIIIGLVAAEQEVAIFRIAFQISLLLPTGLYVANAIYYPRMCELFKSDRVNEIERICQMCCLVGFVFASSVAVMLMLFGETFISFFFQPQYLDSIPILFVLGFVQLLNSFTGPLDLVLTAANLEKLLMKTRGAALLFQIPALAIGAYFYGAIGAAISYGVAFSVWNIVLWIVVYKKLSIVSFPSVSSITFQPRGS